MALVLKDRVKETTTTTGTGTVTLAGAVTGFDAFSEIGNSNTTYYVIAHQSADEWEVGIGTYTSSGTTLSRDTVLSSSNSGSATNFSSGTKDVFCGYPAGKAVNKDANDDVTLETLSITNTTTNDSLALTTTEDSSTAAPVISLKRNSSSPADGDYIGQIKFKGENDADQEVVYAKITGKTSDVTDTTEDGLIEFALRKAGSNNIGARLTSTDLKLINGTGLEVAGNATVTGNITTSDYLRATEVEASNGIIANATTVSANYTIPTNYNALSAGPITIDSGITVTVPSGSVWTVV
jgi:hypothetical protein